MHFSNSLLLCLAASSIAAPTLSNNGGAIAARDQGTNLDQVMSSLEGRITDLAKGDGGFAGAPNPKTNNPSPPAKRDAAKGHGRPAGSPDPITNNPNHPRDAAKGNGGYARRPNPTTNNPNHG